MRVLGVDFTSAPSPKKPITLARCRLNGQALRLDRIDHLAGFASFERFLAEPGPWVCGLDFPFAQARRFIEHQNWPLEWRAYVECVAGMGTRGFTKVVKAFEAAHPTGAKQPHREADRRAGGQPPQKVQWQPVGLMFAQGAPRLLASGAHLPLLNETGADRVALEVYPGVIARRLVGRATYKSETDVDAGRADVRRRLVLALQGPELAERYGVRLVAEPHVLDACIADSKGDALDAVLASVQAAWASQQPGWGIPADADPLEGWISDPHLLEPIAV